MIARAEEAHKEEQSRRATQARGSTRPKGHTGRPVSPVKGPTEDQRRQIILRSASRNPEPASHRSAKEKQPGLRLRSVEPEVQERRRRADALRSAVSATRNEWKESKFHTRVQLLNKISKVAPRGSVREDIIGQFGDPCSTCDERNVASKPVRAEFGHRRLRRKDPGSEQQRRANYNETETDRESSGLVLETALTRARKRIAASRKRAQSLKEKKKETRPFPRIREVLIQESGEEEDPGSDVDFSPGDSSPKGPGRGPPPAAAIAAGGN